MPPKSKEEILEQIKRRGIKKSFLCDLIGGYRGKLTEWEKGKTTLTEHELEIIVNYLFDNSSIQDKAAALYAKYSQLDLYGKNLVDTIIDKEYERCIQLQTLDKSQLVDNEAIETSKGAYKVARAAAFGGGTADIEISADVSTDEINRMIDENKALQRRKKNDKIADDFIDGNDKDK